MSHHYDQDQSPSNPVQRVVYSEKRLDKQRQPWEYVDKELPTLSKHFLVARRGTARAPRGTLLGSMRITGSVRPFNPGTFSARITRVSVLAGSRNLLWFIRHSRIGTIDILGFPSPGQEILTGAPENPVYAVGPGTLVFGFLGNAAGSIGSAYDLAWHMEGYLS